MGGVVDEPSTVAGSPVTFRSWRLPGADVAACSLPQKNQPFFFLLFFFFFFLLFLVGCGGVVWFMNIYERHKPLGAWLLSGSLVSCKSLRF